MPVALPPTLSGLWAHVMRRHPGHRACLVQGVLPLLTRLTLTALEAPIRVDQPVEARAGFLLAHDRDAAGEVAHLLQHVGGAVRRLGPPRSAPARAAGARRPPVRGARRSRARSRRPTSAGCTRLEAEGYPAVPELRYEAPPAATAAEAPAGARWLDDLAPDPAEAAFTLDQTDANQHVNSLVYIRVFLDAVTAPVRRGRAPAEGAARAPSTSRTASRASPATGSARTCACSRPRAGSARRASSPHLAKRAGRAVTSACSRARSPGSGGG